MLSSPTVRATLSAQNSFASEAKGPALLIAPLLILALIALPITWFLPLFRTELLVFLENDVSVIGAARSLWKIDLFIWAIVVLFGMVIPVGKLASLVCAWAILPASHGSAWIEVLNKISKFSMLDVFLIAVTIVGLKGVGLGKVEIAYGLYAFSIVVLAILGLSFWAQTIAIKSPQSAPE